VNPSQQQVIAWLPSENTICSTATGQGKPKIVTFFWSENRRDKGNEIEVLGQ